MSEAKLQISRAQLAAFLKDPDSIKLFEQLFSSTVTNEADIATLTLLVGLGGITESGSNANGYWVKFIDGTMECRHGLYIAAAGSSVWTFPKPFIDTTYRIATHAIQGAGWINSMQEDSTTPRNVASVRMTMYPLVGVAQNLTYDIIAYGRWKL
jgi:hypothetical protein